MTNDQEKSEAIKNLEAKIAQLAASQAAKPMGQVEDLPHDDEIDEGTSQKHQTTVRPDYRSVIPITDWYCAQGAVGRAFVEIEGMSIMKVQKVDAIPIAIKLPLLGRLQFGGYVEICSWFSGTMELADSRGNGTQTRDLELVGMKVDDDYAIANDCKRVSVLELAARCGKTVKIRPKPTPDEALLFKLLYDKSSDEVDVGVVGIPFDPGPPFH